MLFSKYNLTKNHGEFVHLNMLKWALRHVPELGDKTVNDDEIVKSMDVGKGGVDVTTVKDNVTNNRHVPYTDVQVDGESEPVANITTDTIPRGNEQATVSRKIKLDNNGTVLANTGTDIINQDEFDTDSEVNPMDAVGFGHENKLNVDGQEANYITELNKYSYKDGHAVKDETYKFQPYTAVTTDDSNNLESKMEVNHNNDNNLTGVTFPKTGKSYSIRPTTAIADGDGATEDKMVVNHDINNNLTGVTFPRTGKTFNVKSSTSVNLNDKSEGPHKVKNIQIEMDSTGHTIENGDIAGISFLGEDGTGFPIIFPEKRTAVRLIGVRRKNDQAPTSDLKLFRLDYVFGDGNIDDGGQKLTAIKFTKQNDLVPFFTLDVSGLNLTLKSTSYSGN